MMYVHSVERAVQDYPGRPALSLGDDQLSFRDLDNRVRGLAAALSHAGFNAGDRLALLLPNGPEYVQFVYACTRLAIIVVPINSRLSGVEIDHIIADASPRGLVRHSSLPVPSTRVPWELILDKEHLDGLNSSGPDASYAPEAVLALIYTSGTTGRPKGARRTQTFCRMFTASTTVCDVATVASICTLRHFSISPTFLRCSRRLRLAHARSRCRISLRQVFVRPSQRSESRAPF